MSRLLSLLLTVTAGALALGAAATTPAVAETVKIAHSTWVGYGPLYIARDKGFFKKNGVDVDLVKIEKPTERFPAMIAGKIDMIASTVDAALLYMKKPDDFQYVVAIDDSNGGDGVVANKDIQSVADLKGKKVAFAQGSVSQFYLDVLLTKAGLKESDLTAVDMGPGDAGTAFVAGKVDAAVTWEPHLTKGKQSPHGHLLTDSSQTPGLITDVLIANSSWIKQHEKEVKSIVAAWNEAVAYYQSNPEESIAIMAKGVGGFLEDPKEFKETLSGIKFYGADGNKTFFGTKEKPGPLAQVVQNAIDIWSSHDKLQVQTSPQLLINYSFVGG
jgi:NitT/TauT family transport system substrate-binding protein